MKNPIRPRCSSAAEAPFWRESGRQRCRNGFPRTTQRHSDRCKAEKHHAPCRWLGHSSGNAGDDQRASKTSKLVCASRHRVEPYRATAKIEAAIALPAEVRPVASRLKEEVSAAAEVEQQVGGRRAEIGTVCANCGIELCQREAV